MQLRQVDTAPQIYRVQFLKTIVLSLAHLADNQDYLIMMCTNNKSKWTDVIYSILKNEIKKYGGTIVHVMCINPWFQATI